MAPEPVAKKSLFRNKAAAPPSNVILVDGIPLSRDLVEDPSLSDAPPESETAFLDAEAMFRKYDIDRSGGIDLDEFKLLLVDLQIDIPPPKVQVYFKKCDLAQKGFITFDEFRLAMFTCDPTNPTRTNGFCPSKVLNPKDLFAIFDTDDSGEIGRDEFSAILRFLKIKMALDRQEAVFSQFENPVTEGLTYTAFRSLWLTLVDVRKELNNRSIAYNKLLSRAKLAKKLESILDKEDAQEQYTMLEAQWNFNWEQIKERREKLLTNAKRYADYVLGETLDAAGQVYVFGKGSFNRFDGVPAERDFVECPYFSRLLALWTSRVRGAEAFAPKAPSSPEKKSGGWDSPKRRPPIIKTERIARDPTQTQQLAFHNRVVAINTAWLWGRRIKQVSCGASVAYALTDAGELYCWGGTRRTWDYIYCPEHSADVAQQVPGGAASRPYTARTEMLKLSAPHQLVADEHEHLKNYVRTMFREVAPPEVPVESDEAELQRLLVLIDYFELYPPALRAEVHLAKARELLEFNLRADVVANALRLRALQSSEMGKAANATKLSKCLMLELECMGEPFQRQMKKLDQQLLRALHNNQEAAITSVLKKGAALWQRMRQLVTAIDETETTAFQAKQDLWDQKRSEVGRLRHKQARSGQEGVTLSVRAALQLEKTLQMSGLTARGPRQKTFLGHQALQQVSLGAKHALAVHQSGQLYGWGFGTYGRLGSGSHDDTTTPKPLVHLRDMRFRSVACGYSHSLALRHDGQVFVWGSGATGKLGLASPTNEPPDCFTILPLPLALPSKVSSVRKIACGPSHSAVISTNGELYVWGSGDGGRLGLGDGNLGIVSVPTKVAALHDHHIVDVSCGTAHTAVVSAIQSNGVLSSGGRVFVAGSAHALGVFCPAFVTPATLASVQVTTLACGNAHTAAVSIDGELFSWGNNVGGCTGHDVSHRFIATPSRVPCIFQSPSNMARHPSYDVVAIQSTVATGYGASLALDGVTDGAYESTCCQTFREMCPFWQVDLGVMCRVASVRLWNRTGAPGDQLFPCIVYIGQEPFEAEAGKHALREAKAHSIFTKFKLETATNPLVWHPPDNTIGRYVRVQIDGTSILSLAQVEVFGTEEWVYQGPRVQSVASGDDILVAICRPTHAQSDIDKAYLRALCADSRFQSILDEFPTFDTSKMALTDLRRAARDCPLCTVQRVCPLCLLCNELDAHDHDLASDYRATLSLDEIGDFLLSLRPPKPVAPLAVDEENRLARIYVDDEKPESALHNTEARVLAAMSKVVASAKGGPKPQSFLRKAMDTMATSRLAFAKRRMPEMLVQVVRPQSTPSLGTGL
ncbi:hypothetical protein SDRG_02460 [Saprolegnia diclina VS20]|uniref:EF-hand domain-containing protein n=1 Tax=Saprolegnia diclina (strain VS20) TaxID=1156394 RepID=T0SCL7_SAPDV|nr:hypothetical protein SDRG_02460 [Saprolegnia diclina VS20]EQC40572.1 hypothetical protein SDRG_02460 [Saprolegnia diclina VS20]|eukprot:XP_008606271.1 hypothetical protein SDRG_02460 [Saprolegnia diclina VS20]